MTSVTIGDSVTSIGFFAFSGCSSLEKITIPFVGASATATGYQSVFGYIFGYTTYSHSTIKGATYQYYDSSSSSSNKYYHYYIPTSLREVTIAGGDIPQNAFYNCSMLTSITIPDSVTSIGNYAFYYCTALTEINFNATACTDLNSNHDVFYKAGQNGTGITVTIGANVTKIPAYLFHTSPYASKITKVVFEDDSVCESIGSSAFYYCSSLTSVTIGNSVTSIGDQAFYDCSNLTKVYYKGSTEDWKKISIGSYNSSLTKATRYYYSESEPTTSGNYWHYDTDGKTPIVWKKEN